jgi:hypothetical protein
MRFHTEKEASLHRYVQKLISSSVAQGRRGVGRRRRGQKGQRGAERDRILSTGGGDVGAVSIPNPIWRGGAPPPSAAVARIQL